MNVAPDSVSRKTPFTQWVGRITLGILAALVAVFVASLMVSSTWDGSFPATKFRIRCVDVAGKPVQGAELQVRDETGSLRVAWPVSNLQKDSPVESDQDGWMEFYCVHSGSFGGTGRNIMFIWPVGYDEPKYRLEWSVNGDVVAEASFNEWIWSSLSDGRIQKRETWRLSKDLTVDMEAFQLCERTVVLGVR